MISVIIPVKNGVATIQNGLRSLLSQKNCEEAIEVIVVDDGSSDKSAQLAEEAGAMVIRQAYAGPAAARNKGVRAAQGEIILFTDADCVPDQNWVKEMTRPFGDPQVMGVKGVYRTHQTSTIARVIQLEFEERYELLQRYPTIDFVDTYSAGFRSQVFRRLGGFDEAFPYPNNEDVDFSYRMSKAGYKMVFNCHAVVYHSHPDNLLRYFRLKFGRAYWRTITYRLHPDKIIKDTYTPFNLKLQIVSLYLFTISILILMIFPQLVYLSLLTFLIFLLAMSPFIHFVLSKEPTLLIPAILLAMLRAFAFCLGIPAGLLGSLSFRTSLQQER
jgi:GT2 family glycosyltransferase